MEYMFFVNFDKFMLLPQSISTGKRAHFVTADQNRPKHTKTKNI